MSTRRPGPANSTTDLAWDGQASIYENGEMLAETERFPDGDQIAVADVDLDRLRQERLRHGHVSTTTAAAAGIAGRLPARGVRARPADRRISGCDRQVERFPFVPADPARLAQDCYEAYNIQVAGPGAAPARHRHARRP